ncbi:MAG TPA: RidA family protein [Gemmatimonadaceae bacterium]|nr:RidA family protein [Gemmatimonadaceae bacterium]
MTTDVRPANWPVGSGYSHGFSAEGRAVFIAGQIGWNPVTQTIVPGGMAAQVRQALANIATVLEAAGADANHLVRLTWFITDREAYTRDRKAIGAAYREVIGRHFPPMSVIVVAGLLEPGAMVEIEATAVVPSDTRINSTGA